MKQLSIKGVLAGAVGNVVLSAILSVILGLVAGALIVIRIFNAAFGGPRPDIQNMLDTPRWVVIASALIGAYAGGFIAARVARKGEVPNGAIAGGLPVLLSFVYALVSGAPLDAPLVSIAMLIVPAAAGALGGYHQERRLARVALPTRHSAPIR